VNGVLRLISPLGFVLGQLGASAPNQSTLNKQLFGVVASQRSGINTGTSTGTYSAAELASLVGGGWDVITNPGAAAVPIWTCRTGHNSNATIGSAQSDSYTRMNNFIAATLLAGMGVYVGQPITPTLFSNIRATQLGFLQNLLNAGYLSLNSDGSLPYTVKCDATNNPQARTSLGYVQSDDAVTIQGINEKFIVNLEASSSTVTSQTATAQAAGLTTPSSF
jgi:phage tail sheath protein FI